MVIVINRFVGWIMLQWVVRCSPLGNPNTRLFTFTVGLQCVSQVCIVCSNN